MPSAPPRGRNLPAPRDIPPVLDPTVEPVPEHHQLPPHQSKVERIGEHMAALSVDLREYVEIRVALVQRRIEGVTAKIERFQRYAEAAPLFVVAAAFALIGLVFVFLTIGLGLGALFGSMWLGFLATTALLLILAAIFAWLGKRKVDEANAIMAEARRNRKEDQGPTREQIQSAEAKSARQSAV